MDERSGNRERRTRPGRAQVSFELVVRGLFFPSLLIGHTALGPDRPAMRSSHTHGAG